MFRSHYHNSYVAVQASYLASKGQVESFGTADFQYDASAGRYFTPASLASGGTTTSWTSKFTSGTVVPTSGFGPTYGGGTYSLPNFYFVGTNAQNPFVANIAANISNGTTSTFTANIAQATTSAAVGNLNVVSTPTGTGIALGYAISGGGLPTGSFILNNMTGSATSSTSTWQVTVPQGTTIASNATVGTYTVTPVVMTVNAVTSGIVNTGGMLYKATGGPTTNTTVTAQLSGNGGTGTYLVNIPQTYANTAAVTQFMPFVGFNSGDAFRVPMTGNDRTLTGYTALIAYKWGDVTGHVSMMGSSHGNGGDFSWGRNLAVREYNVAGATATGGNASATGWHVTALRFDGTQADNATRFKAWYDGTAESLTFTGTVGTATTAPASITSTVTAATYNSTTDIMTLTYATTGSPAYQASDSIAVAGLSPTTTTDSVTVNGTFTVTACNATSVSYSLPSSGTYTRTSGGTVTGVPIPNLMVSGKAPIASATKNTNPTTATQEINVGELLVYSSVLGDTQIASLITYLKNKWMGTN